MAETNLHFNCTQACIITLTISGTSKRERERQTDRQTDRQTERERQRARERCINSTLFTQILIYEYMTNIRIVGSY